MKRRGLLMLTSVPAAALGLYGAPMLLSRVAFFQLRRVELIGVQYLAPNEVIAGAQLGDERNIFEPLDEIEEAVSAVPGVEKVRVERRLPATLRIHVTERQPVALASGPGGLVPLDARAQPLPYDPARGSIDLPIVPRADSIVTRVLALVRSADPEFFDQIDTAHRDRNGVALQWGEHTVILSDSVSREAITSAAAVRRHLSEVDRAYTEIDARFEGLVIVRGRAT
jgi:cell division protein FtsQ